MTTSPASSVEVEIAVTSPAGVRAAIAGGADRIELCAALELGGLTPTSMTTEYAVATGIPVHVLIRCRPGGFVYSSEEIDWMADEAAQAISVGATGVVFGALTADNKVDSLALARIAKAARKSRPDAQVTFHRAVDHLRDPAAHLDDLVGAGVDRVLTSGGEASAGEGLRTIRKMLDRDTGIEIMAGGGVSLEHLERIVTCGVHGVHLSAKIPVRQTSQHRVPLGSAASIEGDRHYETDESVVREVVRVVDRLATGSAAKHLDRDLH